MELDHFRVLEGHAGPQGSRHAVACRDVGGAGAQPKQAGITACGKDQSFGLYGFDFSGFEIADDYAGAYAAAHHDVKKLTIHEKFYAGPKSKVETGVQQDVAGFVSGKIGPGVAVSAHHAAGYPAVRPPSVGRSPVVGFFLGCA